MWRVALRYFPLAGDGLHWEVAQCWNLRGQPMLNPVKVERKNPRRKRLIMVCPWSIPKGRPVDPLSILECTLDAMPDADKLRLISEGIA